MGRRQTKRQANVVFVFFISLLVLYFLGRFFTWLVSLPPVLWLFIALGIASLVLAKRQFSQQQKKKEDERRKLEIERLGNLDELKTLSPISFEYYICDVFKQLGFDAHVTRETGDGGKDILVYKKDFHAIVECKRYVKTKVTRPHIQKFHSAIIDCKADKGYFITTGEFTTNAVSYVLDKPIELIDGQKLVRLVEKITKESCAPEHIDMILKTT